eukprot:UN00870
MSDSESFSLTTTRIRLAGCGGILCIFAILACWGFNVAVYDVQLGSLDTKQELIDFYNLWMEAGNVSSCLFFCALSWISIPALCYFGEVLFLIQGKLGISWMNKKLIAIFFNILIITFCILPVPLIVGKTFIWDFSDESDSTVTGYFIQLAMVRMFIILIDSCMIPLVCINYIPWNLIIHNPIISFSFSGIITICGLIQMVSW